MPAVADTDSAFASAAAAGTARRPGRPENYPGRLVPGADRCDGIRNAGYPDGGVRQCCGNPSADRRYKPCRRRVRAHHLVAAVLAGNSGGPVADWCGDCAGLADDCLVCLAPPCGERGSFCRGRLAGGRTAGNASGATAPDAATAGKQCGTGPVDGWDPVAGAAGAGKGACACRCRPDADP